MRASCAMSTRAISLPPPATNRGTCGAGQALCDGDRNLPDTPLPFARPGFVHRLARRVDGHGDRHVDDLELVDRLHAEVRERDDARAADRLRYKIGRPADRHKVGGSMATDRIDC